MNNILKDLKSYAEKEYGDFQFKLTPGFSREHFLGVRVPLCREIAKKLIKNNDYIEFLNNLPHEYYDEDILHSCILSLIKDYDYVIEEVDKFLPYINNWAVCDILTPIIFKKRKIELYEKIKIWLKSDKTYTIRFAIEMLMNFYLDEDFSLDHLKLVSSIRSEEYYVRMMIAWYFATALAKKYEECLPILLDKKLDSWTHNKTIQKAIESNRIAPQQKEYLRSIKVK